MPDIDPAALSRPSISLSTPTLASKTITVSAPGSQKIIKTSQIIPPRIDLEPLYTALKAVIPSEQWLVYKESISQFLIGKPRTHRANSGNLEKRDARLMYISQVG